jgi:hypothetical protein
MALTEEDIFRALSDGEFMLPPLKVRLIEKKPKLRALGNSTYRPDALVEISRNRRRWKFLAELIAVSKPQAFNNAIAAIVSAAKKAKLPPMIVMPYLSPEHLSELESQGISGLDLCGNGVVTIDDELLVVRTGQPNRYRSSEPIRNVYRGDSSLVARVFLARPEFRSVGEIEKAIRELGATVTLSTVSKVTKALEGDLIVSREQGSIRLLQPDKLLEALATNYRAPKVKERFVGKVALDESQLQQALAQAARKIGAKFVLTGAASATKYAVMGREPIVAAYCSAAPADLIAALSVRVEQTDRFPNLDLATTTDAPVYFDAIDEGGVSFSSPIQTYLELASGDKRQRETAAQVREYLLRRVRPQGTQS